MLKGLSLASHEDLAKLFKDFEITLKNPLLTMNLEGTVMDKIVEVMETALMQYTLYSLLGQWMASSRKHADRVQDSLRNKSSE